MQKLLLCDLDNTLYDRDRAFSSWAAAFLEQQGIQDEGLLQWMIAIDDKGYAPREQVFRSAKERFQLSESVEGLIADYRTRFPLHARATEETRAALADLRAMGWRIGVVSNGHGTAQRAKIDSAGLVDLIDGIAISSEEGVRKPDPELFRIAAARCDLDADHGGWVIGDNAELHIAPALTLGLSAIWLSGGAEWPLERLRPTHTASSVTDAIQMIALEGSSTQSSLS